MVYVAESPLVPLDGTLAVMRTPATRASSPRKRLRGLRRLRGRWPRRLERPAVTAHVRCEVMNSLRTGGGAGAGSGVRGSEERRA
ncbi:hypothetical protein GCM10009535_24800 [Streptomyces thermocarboxydovorans]|uniref:Uncharacterized protein n=1 Tax=Streptomyces thermocarboxydovorans TaxID=59298 RepID=A0ABN1HG84_9ACTN